MGVRLWTNEKVIADIKQLNKDGESLLSINVRESHPDLFSAGRRQFGCWQEAVKACDIDYGAIPSARISHDDACQKAIAELRQTKEQGEDISATAMYNKNAKKVIHNDRSRLYHNAASLFGSWKKFVNAAGYNYSRYKKQNSWSKRKITKRILQLYDNKQPVWKCSYMQHLYPALVSIAKYYFGSYKKAFESTKLPTQYGTASHRKGYMYRHGNKGWRLTFCMDGVRKDIGLGVDRVRAEILRRRIMAAVSDTHYKKKLVDTLIDLKLIDGDTVPLGLIGIPEEYKKAMEKI